MSSAFKTRFCFAQLWIFSVYAEISWQAPLGKSSKTFSVRPLFSRWSLGAWYLAGPGIAGLQTRWSGEERVDMHRVVRESEAGLREDTWGGGSPAVRGWGAGCTCRGLGQGQQKPRRPEGPDPRGEGRGGPEGPNPGGEGLGGGGRWQEAAQGSCGSREHLGFCCVGRGCWREGGRDAGSLSVSVGNRLGKVSPGVEASGKTPGSAHGSPWERWETRFRVHHQKHRACWRGRALERAVKDGPRISGLEDLQE